MSNLDRPAVQRVREALLAAGLADTIVELADTARTFLDTLDESKTRQASFPFGTDERANQRDGS